MKIKIKKIRTDGIVFFGYKSKRIPYVTRNKEYDVLCSDYISFSDEYYTILGINISRLSILDDNCDVSLIDIKYVEVTDESIPDFWDKRIEGNRNEYIFLGPKGWNPDFWDKYQDGDYPERIKFYTEYTKLYKKNIKLSEEPKIFEDGLNIIFLGNENKRSKNVPAFYLKQIDNLNEFLPITEFSEGFDKEYFGLTKNKIYKVHEFRNRDDYWYKVKNDNGIELFYPRTLFSTLKDDSERKFNKFNLKDRIENAIPSVIREDNYDIVKEVIDEHKKYLKDGKY